MKSRTNYRKVYESVHGKIPKGYHIHHITPKHLGGTDEIDNLVALSVEDHFMAHYNRWKLEGSVDDLRACLLLKRNCMDLSDEEKRLVSSKGGKAAQKTLRERKTSAFYDPELRHEISSKGGKNGFLSDAWYRRHGYETPEEIKEAKRIDQSNRGKVGGKGNKGFVWVTDGETNIKYSVKRMKEQSVEEFIEENPEFRVGRTIKENEKSTCPHCGKRGATSAMVLWHFDKCKKK